MNYIKHQIIKVKVKFTRQIKKSYLRVSGKRSIIPKSILTKVSTYIWNV